jgi:hypothetical protein
MRWESLCGKYTDALVDDDMIEVIVDLILLILIDDVMVAELVVSPAIDHSMGVCPRRPFPVGQRVDRKVI